MLALDQHIGTPIKAKSWYRNDLVKKIFKYPPVWEKYTDQKLPAKIQTKIFQSLDIFLQSSSKFSPDNKVFSQGLYYFSESDKELIENIKNALIGDKAPRLALLIGDPASGKTVMSISIAKDLKELGYRSFFHRVTSKSKFNDIWDDIVQNDSPQVLFILETCHLNIDIANHIYSNFCRIQNAACLLISRDIPKKIRYSSELENLDIFEELRDQTFKLDLTLAQNLDDKVGGIIRKYQNYYENIFDSKFIIGDEKIIIQKIRYNLLTLYYYLKFWPDTKQLDQSKQDVILQKIYERYLISEPQEILLKYASLYQYEIQIDPLDEEKTTSELLLKKGLLKFEPDYGYYCFYHSAFARLLLEAYTSCPEFNRKYQDLQDFVLKQIVKYLSSFENFYPSNLDELFRNLVLNKAIPIFKELLTNTNIRNQAVNFFLKKGTAATIVEFFILVSRHAPNYIEFFSECLITDNSSIKALFIEDKDALLPFIRALIVLKESSPTKYKSFFSSFTSEELKYLVLNTSFIKFASIQCFWGKLEDIRKILFGSITAIELTQKAQKIPFNTLFHVFGMLKDIDERKVRKAIDIYPTDVLAGQAEREHFSVLTFGLSNIRAYHELKASQVLSRIQISLLIAKAQESQVSFVGLAKGLSDLSKIDLKKSQRLINHLDEQILLEKAQYEDIKNLARGLNQLYSLSEIKTKNLLLKFETKDLMKKMQGLSFTEFAQALNQLNNINSSKTAIILQQVDLHLLIEKIQKEQIHPTVLGKSLVELSHVNLEKAQEILRQINTSTLVTNICEQTIKLSEFGTALNNFNKIDPDKSKTMLRQIKTPLLLTKAKQGGFTGFILGITALKKVDPQRACKLLEWHITSDLVKKAESKNVAFNTLIDGLSKLRYVNSKKVREIYHQIDPALITSKIKNENIKISQIKKAFDKLSKIDLEKSREVFSIFLK